MISFVKPNGTGFAFSPDGKYAVSGTENNPVLFDLTTYQKIKEFSGHQDFVQALAFTHDSKSFVSVSYDQTVRIWDVASGAELRKFTLAEGIPTSVCVAPASRYIVVGNNLGHIYIWDMQTGESRVLSAHKDGVKGVQIAGDILVSGSLDGTAKLWNVTTGELSQSLAGHKAPVFAVAIAADGSFALTGSADKTMRVWDTATGQELFVATGHTDAVVTMSTACDGKWMASGSSDRTVRFWEIATGQERFCWKTENEANAVAFSSKARKVAAGDNSKIFVWDAKTGQSLFELNGHTNQVRWLGFNCSGQYLYSAGWEGDVCQWDMASGKLVTKVTTQASIECVVLLNEGKSLACGHWNGNITVWDMESGKQVSSWKAHNLVVNSFFLSHDGNYIISVSEDRNLKLWKATTGSLLGSVEVGPILRAALVPGQDVVAVLLSGKTIELWSVPTLTKNATLTQTSQPVSIVCPQEGSGFMVGNGCGTIYLYREKR